MSAGLLAGPNLYNEIEPFAAEWMRNLAQAGHISVGTVDQRSIRDLRPVDVGGATQFHAFAGLGAWSYALRLAGWPDDQPVWTGSCPCQPFSGAGRKGGFDDERHGSIGKVVAVRNGFFYCEWVYGRNVKGEVMRGGPSSVHRYDLVACTEDEYEARANREGFGS